MKPAKKRIDQLLVERGLAESRQKAQALILAGQVFVADQKVEKAGQPVPTDAQIRVAGRPLYVSRGGPKLAAALDHFGIGPGGRVCLDIGASTGGFTDCLLQRGAARVYAVDVGAGQLDWRLRTDPRVRLIEHCNARYLRPEDIGEPCDLAVCDVSFISATLIVPVIPPLLRESGEMVILVKPQFEVGREQVGKGGVVRDPELHRAACARVQAAVEAVGFRTRIMASPIPGAEGNREFLLYGKH
ncbi:MAG: TlyA family RNA methyltransferase [Acidobacteria bacterium]|nr:TlyA family RNA methyltransferase [Acidobacteriota bacterium]MBI3278297.1 TlyA family RNA methyltransferase [Acidobacteriota bacterium]